MRSFRQYYRDRRLSHAMEIVERNLDDPNHWLLETIKKAGGSASGEIVTVDTAMGVSAIWASIKVLSETVASLPFKLFKRDGDNKKLATEHPNFDLFKKPNDYMTGFEFRENQVSNINYHGNDYSQKVEKAGYVRQLIPLSPQWMQVARPKDSIVYTYTESGSGEPKIFRANKVWHVKNVSISCTYNSNAPAGTLGISPISIGKEIIGEAQAASSYGGRFFANNATVGLHLKSPNRLSDNAKEFLKKSLEEFAKRENKFKSMITEEGVEVDQIGGNNEESQFIELRGFSIEEMARLMRVATILIGHPDKTMTYASAEQMFRSFVLHTLVPLVTRIETSANRWTLPEKDQADYFWEHNLAGLLRGDTKTQYEAFAKGRNWGWLNVDEIRAMLNMNALPDEKGQIYLEPKNMNQPGTDSEGGPANAQE